MGLSMCILSAGYSYFPRWCDYLMKSEPFLNGTDGVLRAPRSQMTHPRFRPAIFRASENGAPLQRYLNTIIPARYDARFATKDKIKAFLKLIFNTLNRITDSINKTKISPIKI